MYNQSLEGTKVYYCIPARSIRERNTPMHFSYVHVYINYILTRWVSFKKQEYCLPFTSWVHPQFFVRIHVDHPFGWLWAFVVGYVSPIFFSSVLCFLLLLCFVCMSSFVSCTKCCQCLDCPYFIASSVYINVYLQTINHVRVDKGDTWMATTMKDDEQGRKHIFFQRPSLVSYFLIMSCCMMS